MHPPSVASGRDGGPASAVAAAASVPTLVPGSSGGANTQEQRGGTNITSVQQSESREGLMNAREGSTIRAHSLSDEGSMNARESSTTRRSTASEVSLPVWRIEAEDKWRDYNGNETPSLERLKAVFDAGWFGRMRTVDVDEDGLPSFPFSLGASGGARTVRGERLLAMGFSPELLKAIKENLGLRIARLLPIVQGCLEVVRESLCDSVSATIQAGKVPYFANEELLRALETALFEVGACKNELNVLYLRGETQASRMVAEHAFQVRTGHGLAPLGYEDAMKQARKLVKDGSGPSSVDAERRHRSNSGSARFTGSVSSPSSPRLSHNSRGFLQRKRSQSQDQQRDRQPPGSDFHQGSAANRSPGGLSGQRQQPQFGGAEQPQRAPGPNRRF